MPRLSRLETCFLDGITLQEPVEFLLAAPSSLEVVEVDVARQRIANHRIAPFRKLHLIADRLGAEELRSPEDRLRQAESITSLLNRDGVADLSMDLNDVRNGSFSCSSMNETDGLVSLFPGPRGQRLRAKS